MLEGGDRQLGEPPAPVVGLRVDALQAHADDLVEERPHEVVLAAEVAVDRRRVRAELGAEVAHRDGAHARLCGELEPGGHDRLAVEARLSAAAARAGGRGSRRSRHRCRSRSSQGHAATPATPCGIAPAAGEAHPQHNELINSDVNSVDIAVVVELQSPRPTVQRGSEGDVPADLLFTGGPVFTGTGHPLHGHAVAVTGGRITAVVPESDAHELIDERTRVVQLGRRAAQPRLPGRAHPPGRRRRRAPAVQPHRGDGCRRHGRPRPRLRRREPRRAVDPRRRLVDGPLPGRRARSAALLDEVVPDRPVLLLSRDHHSTWANSAAIRLAGIDASTPDPADGRIEREADGSPAGTFHEGAGDLFDGVRPPVDPDLAYAGLLRAQRELLALGITGWQDAMVGGSIGGVPDPIDAYRRALAEDELVVHVVGAQWWERDRGIEQVDEMTARREAVAALGREDRLSLGTTKIMVDGVAENQTAAMLTPYRDVHGHDTHNHGLSFVDPALLQGYVTALDAAGFQVHFHALGDRAVREALDALDTARAANGATDGRHHLAHLQVVEETETARFAELGAVANIQALWATPRGPDRRAHPAVPAGRRRGPAVPVRRPRAPRRAPRRRQRLARLERRPDGRDPHRRQPGRARQSTPSRSAAPTSASTSPPRWPPTRRAPPT